MSLGRYNKKRDFNKTPEPKGKVDLHRKNLFLIQKHAASHLHYDFRLELHGVLKSWAIPKGPCLDPTVKRLAMHVEDHPVQYGSFEGIIPKGEYGGGTVMLWDSGKWHCLEDNAQQAYEKGHLRFELNGQKLKGRWDLIRFKDDKHWFLIKYQDDFAKPLNDFDITVEQPNSVKSQQSIEEIAENYENVWTKKGLEKAPKKKIKPSAIHLPEHLKPGTFPKKISPQLASLVDKAPSGTEWAHEIKFDGYRMIAFKNKETVLIKSRNHKDWTEYFPNIAAAIKKLPVEKAIFDGELVLLDEQHKSNFQLLQNSIKSHTKAPFIYYIFDLLYYDQYDLKSLPLIERKEILASLLNHTQTPLLYSNHIVGDGSDVFSRACEFALEGIISKRLNSHYVEKRSKSWLKVKCIQRQEFVIGGYLPPQGSRQFFGSLLLGVFNDQGELVYCGNVGTGFSDASLKEVFSALEKQSTTKNPFNTRPPNVRKTKWVSPVLVAEVEFTEWTQEGHLRHPSFQGLRWDKKAEEIMKEKEISLKEIKAPKAPAKKSTFKITHPEKILYPEDNITKQALLNYYEEIHPYILPYVINRPLSLVRCPDTYLKCFYQKHFNDATPKALKSILITSKSDGDGEPYIYLTDKEGLLSLVQMSVLELHPWGSKITNLEYPDIIIIDLDPAPDVPWKSLVTAAFDIKKRLEDYELTCFVKTTGGKGLHVVIPIQPEYDWDQVKQFTHVFVKFLEQINPAAYISKMTKSKRTGKIFVDYLRNQRGATAIAPYSSRARPQATVSVPIHWDELTSDSRDTFYTIHTLPARLHSLKVDPWKQFWTIKQSLRLDKLE